MIASNCKHGSAWHDWQSAGYAWRKLNKAPSAFDISAAAVDFARTGDWPNLGVAARYRAFLEGVNAYHIGG